MCSQSSSEDESPAPSNIPSPLTPHRQPPKDDDDAELWALFEAEWKVFSQNLPDL
jgi:hypothetical protein